MFSLIQYVNAVAVNGLTDKSEEVKFNRNFPPVKTNEKIKCY